MNAPVAIKLLLEDGTEMSGRAFGAAGSVGGEVVFNTGMTGRRGAHRPFVPRPDPRPHLPARRQLRRSSAARARFLGRPLQNPADRGVVAVLLQTIVTHALAWERKLAMRAS